MATAEKNTRDTRAQRDDVKVSFARIAHAHIYRYSWAKLLLERRTGPRKVSAVEDSLTFVCAVKAKHFFFFLSFSRASDSAFARPFK